MDDLIQIHRARGILTQSGCPKELLDNYLDFLQNGGQQVQIVRNEVAMMFQQEQQYRKRRHETMSGSVTFRNKDGNIPGDSDTGVFIGMEFIQCCFNYGILARMLNIRKEHGKVVESVVGFGV